MRSNFLTFITDINELTMDFSTRTFEQTILNCSKNRTFYISELIIRTMTKKIKMRFKCRIGFNIMLQVKFHIAELNIQTTAEN